MALFFDDMRDALRSYLADELEIEIVDLVEVDNPDGQDININETWCFRVKCVNRGPVGIVGAVVQVDGLNGTTVSTATDGPWHDTISAEPIDVGIGRRRKTTELYFKAPDTAGPMELLEVQVTDWNANLDPMLVRHSVGTNGPVEVFSSNVVGD